MKKGDFIWAAAIGEKDFGTAQRQIEPEPLGMCRQQPGWQGQCIENYQEELGHMTKVGGSLLKYAMPKEKKRPPTLPLVVKVPN